MGGGLAARFDGHGVGVGQLPSRSNLVDRAVGGVGLGRVTGKEVSECFREGGVAGCMGGMKEGKSVPCQAASGGAVWAVDKAQCGGWIK